MKNKFSIATSAILCAALLAACAQDNSLPSWYDYEKNSTSDTTDEFISLSEVSETTSSSEQTGPQQSENEVQSGNASAWSADAEKSMANAEKQIEILENYYNSLTCKPFYPKIYDLSGYGDCVLLYLYYVVTDEPEYDQYGFEHYGYYKFVLETVKNDKPYELYSSQKIFNNELNEEDIDNTIGRCFSLSEDTGKIYMYSWEPDALFYRSYTYSMLKNGELSEEFMVLYDSMSCIYNGHRVEEDITYPAFQEPIMTKMDGDVEIYLPDYSLVMDKPLVAEATLLEVQGITLEVLPDNTARITWPYEDMLSECDSFRLYRKDGMKYTCIEETTDDHFDIALGNDEYEYCVTLYCSESGIKESDYSETVIAPRVTTSSTDNKKTLNINELYAVDYLDFSLNDIQQYSENGFEQYADVFKSNNIPGLYFNGKTMSDPMTEIIVYQKGVSVEEGIVFSDTLMKDIAEKYSITKCRLRSKWSPSGYRVKVSLNIGKLTYSFLFEGIIDESRYNNEDELYEAVDSFYDGKVINLSDLSEFVVYSDDMSSGQCTISRNDLW